MRLFGLSKADLDAVAHTKHRRPAQAADQTDIQQHAAIRTLAVMVTAIFTLELAIMLIFFKGDRATTQHLIESLLDSSLLTLVLYPVIHLFAYRPLLQHITERKHAEEALQEACDALEIRVQERTADLAKANGELQTEIARRRQAEETLRQSFEKLQGTLEATIQAMASTLELKDPYTAGHQRRVAKLACAIAKDMCLSQDQVNTIHLAAVIHDIGKITVPAEILSKPGRLNEIEFGLIKVHPQVGYDILKTIEFPWSIAQIVLQHHERIDGSGYPTGLADKAILLEARILSVADVIEAIASHRPYRPALGLTNALEEITRNSGVLYDADVVQACLRVVAKRGFEWDQTKDSGCLKA